MYKYLKKDENFHVCKIKYISVSIKKIVEYMCIYLYYIPYIFYKDVQYIVFIFFFWKERSERRKKITRYKQANRIQFPNIGRICVMCASN